MIYLLLLLIDVKPKDRVHNETKCQCVWATYETIARHYGMTEFYDLTKKYPGPVNALRALWIFDAYNIKYYWDNTKDWSNLRNGLRNGWPAAVVVYNEDLQSTHMFLVIGIDKDWVYIIDNDSEKSNTRWSLPYFEKYWKGITVFIDPKRKTASVKKRWLFSFRRLQQEPFYDNTQKLPHNRLKHHVPLHFQLAIENTNILN